jgi:hypothetical protein
MNHYHVDALDHNVCEEKEKLDRELDEILYFGVHELNN